MLKLKQLSSDSNVWRKWHVRQMGHLPQDHYNAQAQNYPVTLMFDDGEQLVWKLFEIRQSTETIFSTKTEYVVKWKPLGKGLVAFYDTHIYI